MRDSLYKIIMSKYTRETLENAVTVIKKIVQDKNVKLKFGANQRQMIKKQLAKGETVNNYRTVWMLHVMKRIRRVLVEEAMEFDKEYKYDKVSVQDFIDVLLSVANEFDRATKKN